ncbi:MAG: nucleotidyl transferase AbiEii/AbiGii toxin family protein [Gomphosphaeria aponina SAG 52.96 = DSM 107014]|uniref:Nucleotidyl transferase AbiEii/AbiGii toxin family protein n=1 Tax=Gomphosphaeria aponina SAG 52.96 = DSM 107014 TaxID=1521640 RepID=A0A941GUW9_9CHRO|nr:nucleotidyl transferase AbiEii/AbiGii toxin family protein [Gomphosphaeria aponina SAG 52.96 = DSM 107014]
MNFKFDFHHKILTILESLNGDLLRESFAYFGGGTLIALDYGEYRQSKDIDFLCPVALSGYKNLRSIIFDRGYEGLFRNLNDFKIQRATTDQYGIRMAINVAGIVIKTEIIAEERFPLDSPRYPHWSPVPCLSHNDCFTAKLLANSDRYLDDSVTSRDLIDLAILRLHSSLPQLAIEKAEQAYEVIRPLAAAIKRFQSRPDYRQKCYASLQIDNSQIPIIIDGIDLLANDLDLASTERTFLEQLF